jgi:geranylgeranyl diphosphate synthase type I
VSVDPRFASSGSGLSTITDVPGVLARSWRSVSPAMIAAIGRLHPDIERVASYHIGWTDSLGKPVDAPLGKGIRAALALLSAQAAWSDPAVGVPGAVAVELVHNFSLIHDDIIDNDTQRRHRPTVWSKFGVGRAIIAGDALANLAHQVLLDGPAGNGPAASAALAEATALMIAGQADDLAFETRDNVTVKECMAMSAAKTGALLGCASSIGALLAGAPAATVGALSDYGRHLGLAFQAVDDLLGIWGDPARTGKPVGSDLRQRKNSMPVVSALAAGGEQADELRTLLFGRPRSPAADRSPTTGNGHVRTNVPLEPDDIEKAAYLIEACGGRHWTAQRAKSHLDWALGALDQVRLSALAQRELADLAVYVVERES